MKFSPLCLYNLPHDYCHAKVWETIEPKTTADIERIENLLTADEKCIACVYSLRAKGQLKQKFNIGKE